MAKIDGGGGAGSAGRRGAAAVRGAPVRCLPLRRVVLARWFRRARSRRDACRRELRSGARCVDPMLRPHARTVAKVCARHMVAPAACACSATTACASTALACVAVLCARSVCAAPSSGPTCLLATTARRRHPRPCTRPVCRRPERPSSARPHPAPKHPARSRTSMRSRAVCAMCACTAIVRCGRTYIDRTCAHTAPQPATNPRPVCQCHVRPCSARSRPAR